MYIVLSTKGNIFTDCLTNDDGVLTLEFDKNVGNDLGVVLKIVENEKTHRIIIDDIISASVADRYCSLL